MKEALIISIALIAAGNCLALHLAEPNQVLVTVEPNASPTYEEIGFDVSGQITAWIDNRDDFNYVPRIYFTHLNDPCRTEHLIDADAVNVSAVRVDGNSVYYDHLDSNSSTIFIRKVDCTDINNLVAEDINTNVSAAGYFPSSVESFSVDGDRVVYVEREYYGYARIYAINLNEPNRPRHLVYDLTGGDKYLQTNVVIDGTISVWSTQENVNSIWSYYLIVADITDVNNPSIQKTIMPRSNGKESWLGSLDISGDWLVAYGSYSSENEIFGIHNFQNADANQWDIVELWDGTELDCELCAPAIDGSYAVWPVIYGQGGTGSAIIAGATLFDNGLAATSLLKETYDPNIDFSAVHINGSEIVWSLYYYNDYYVGLQYADLYSGILVSDCGDWGYLFADFNHDCNVNFLDFAIFAEDYGVNFLEFATFAEQWLDCTTPGGENCVYGEI